MSDKKRVLIIEDELILLEALVKKIEKEGFAVLSAHNGEDGLALIKREKPDLVLLDLMLPGMSGEELLKKLREIKKFKDLPVIVMSAKSDRATISHCLNNLGASSYLVKTDCTLEEVAEKINKTLQ